MTVSRRLLARHVAHQLASGADRTNLLQELAAYLITNKQTGQLELVVADIVRNLAELGTIEAKVTVAHPLTAELTEAVKAYVSQLEGVKHVQITETIDPELLGGIVIETPRKRLDAAVSTQLKRLRNV